MTAAAPSTLSSSTSSSAASNQWAQLSFVEVLEDLSSRFIVNLPSDELQRIERICFQVEQAHWFYEDFLRPLNPTLPSLNLRKFSIYILQTASLSVPLIRQYVSSDNDANSSGTIQDLSALGSQTYGLEAAFDEFMKYKTRVPVCGAVLLSEDWKSCVLVKGWKASAAWGFPKGKINQSETHRDCAVRETLEETGFDCSALLSPQSPHWMELNVREQKMRLYIVPGVHKDTIFETQTRKEISKISWFKLSDLPTWKQSHAGGGGGLASANAAAKFYLVTPFIGKLKQWIRDNNKRFQIGQGGAAGQVDCAAATSAALPSMQANLPRNLTIKPHNHDPIGLPQTGSAASNTAGVPLKERNGSSVDLLAILQGSSAKPAPPQTLTTAPSNHQPQQSGRSASPANSRPVSQDRLRHHRQPSETEQTLIEHLQKQRISPPVSQSPLPAPRATKSSSDTLKLMEMLSPCASDRTAKPDEKPEGRSTEPLPGGEDERGKKREALLQQLMRAEDASPRRRPATTGHGPQNLTAGESSAHALPTSEEAKLLTILQGPNRYEVPQQQQQHRPLTASFHSSPPIMPASYVSSHVHMPPHPQPPHLPMLHSLPSTHQLKHTTNVPDYAESPDIGRASLLAMLSAGPVATGGGGPLGPPPSSQQQLQRPHPSLFHPQMPMGPLNGHPNLHFHQTNPSPFPWGLYPNHHPSHPSAFAPPLTQGSGPFYQMNHTMPGPGHPMPLQALAHQDHLYSQGQMMPGTLHMQQNNGAGQPFPQLPYPAQGQQSHDGASLRASTHPAQSNVSGPAPAKNQGNAGGLLALLNGS